MAQLENIHLITDAGEVYCPVESEFTELGTGYASGAEATICNACREPEPTTQATDEKTMDDIYHGRQ